MAYVGNIGLKDPSVSRRIIFTWILKKSRTGCPWIDVCRDRDKWHGVFLCLKGTHTHTHIYIYIYNGTWFTFDVSYALMPRLPLSLCSQWFSAEAEERCERRAYRAVKLR